MDLEKTIKKKDEIIRELIKRLESCQCDLSYAINVTLKVKQIIKRNNDGNMEVMMITNYYNTPDGIIVQVV